MISGRTIVPADLMHLALLVSDASAAVVAGPGGEVSPMPGMAGHRLLADGSPLVEVALCRLAERHIVAAFLCPDGNGAYLRVTALSAGTLATVIVLSPGGDLLGLTPRELEVLGRLIDGALTHEIARRLSISDRTVSAHLEHIRAKLNAPTSMVAAVQSLQRALFVPPQLAATARGPATVPGPRH